MRVSFLHGAPSALALALVATATMATCGGRVTADEPQHEDGRIVTISPDVDASSLPAHDKTLLADDENGSDEQTPAAPAYWLGIQGQPLTSDVLRTHLQLAEGVGVVVEAVVPGSPAEKAGVRKHDVLLDVNGDQISDMAVLQKAVADSGGKAIELKVIRLAKETTLKVTPEAPPADLAARMSELGSASAGLPGGPQMGELNAMLQQLQQNGLGGAGVRVFGPGMILGGDGGPQLNLQNMPHNVQVTITRNGDEAAKVMVKRGDESWTIASDDKEALAKLPDDVRPFVEQMLQNNGSGAGVMHQFPGNGNVQGALPGQLGTFNFSFDNADLDAARKQAAAAAGAAVDGAQEVNQGLIQRLEDLEKHLQRLEDQLQEKSGDEAQDSSESSSR